MATYHALGATGQAIVGLLTDALNSAPEFTHTRIALVQASQFKDAKPFPENIQGLSVYLYRISPDASVRNMPPRTAPNGRRYRPSLPVHLHYLITPWADNALTEHQLLGWAIRMIENVSTLPAGLLNAYAPPPIGTDSIFRDAESVDLILEPLTAQELVNIMTVFTGQNQATQLSVSYLARVLMLDSMAEYPDRAPVVTRQFDLEKVQS